MVYGLGFSSGSLDYSLALQFSLASPPPAFTQSLFPPSLNLSAERGGGVTSLQSLLNSESLLNSVKSDLNALQSQLLLLHSLLLLLHSLQRD